VETKDGLKINAFDSGSAYYPIIGKIHETLCSWNLRGENSSGSTTSIDLVLVVKGGSNV
jgi:hypothetical protein